MSTVSNQRGAFSDRTLAITNPVRLSSDLFVTSLLTVASRRFKLPVQVVVGI